MDNTYVRPLSNTLFTLAQLQQQTSTDVAWEHHTDLWRHQEQLASTLVWPIALLLCVLILRFKR